ISPGLRRQARIDARAATVDGSGDISANSMGYVRPTGTVLEPELAVRSGYAGAIARGNNATAHAAAGCGVGARTTDGIRFEHPPGRPVGQQSGQHGVVELVAATNRAVGAEQRQT